MGQVRLTVVSHLKSSSFFIIDRKGAECAEFYGFLCALRASREGSLWGISALHSVWNWIQGNFFGFQVSGMDIGGGSLLNLKTVGADWLTGGAFGPEGGLAVMFVLVLSIAVTSFWKMGNPSHTAEDINLENQGL